VTANTSEEAFCWHFIAIKYTNKTKISSRIKNESVYENLLISMTTSSSTFIERKEKKEQQRQI